MDRVFHLYISPAVDHLFFQGNFNKSIFAVQVDGIFKFSVGVQQNLAPTMDFGPSQGVVEHELAEAHTP